MRVARSRSATTSPATRSSCTCRPTRPRWSCRCPSAGTVAAPRRRGRRPRSPSAPPSSSSSPTTRASASSARPRPRHATPCVGAARSAQRRPRSPNGESAAGAGGAAGAQAGPGAGRRPRRGGGQRAGRARHRRRRARRRVGRIAGARTASEPAPGERRSRSAGSGGRWRATWPRRGATSRTSRCSTRSTPGRCSAPCATSASCRARRRITLTAFFVRAAVVALDAPTRSSTRALDEAAEEIVYHDAMPRGHRGGVERRPRGSGRARRAVAAPRSSSATRSTASPPLARAGHLPPDEIRGRDLHHHQLRHRRRTLRHADRAAAAGRDPRVRRDPRRNPSSTATRWSPRRRSRSRCRPTTAWSTATTRPRSSTRWRRSCANRCQLLDD